MFNFFHNLGVGIMSTVLAITGIFHISNNDINISATSSFTTHSATSTISTSSVKISPEINDEKKISNVSPQVKSPLIQSSISKPKETTVINPVTIEKEPQKDSSFNVVQIQIDQKPNEVIPVDSKPTPPPTPTISLSADAEVVPFEGSTTIKWTSINAKTCNMSILPTPANFNGFINTSGSMSTGNLSQPVTYTVSCTGEGGEQNASRTVNVLQPKKIECIKDQRGFCSVISA